PIPKFRKARHVCGAERVKGESVCHVAHKFPPSSRGLALRAVPAILTKPRAPPVSRAWQVCLPASRTMLRLLVSSPVATPEGFPGSRLRSMSPVSEARDAEETRPGHASPCDRLESGDHALAVTPIGGVFFVPPRVSKPLFQPIEHEGVDRKSTRLNSSHVKISYAVFCLKKKNNNTIN